jgi:hypothetical protein
MNSRQHTRERYQRIRVRLTTWYPIGMVINYTHPPNCVEHDGRSSAIFDAVEGIRSVIVLFIGLSSEDVRMFISWTRDWRIGDIVSGCP